MSELFSLILETSSGSPRQDNKFTNILTISFVFARWQIAFNPATLLLFPHSFPHFLLATGGDLVKKCQAQRYNLASWLQPSNLRVSMMALITCQLVNKSGSLLHPLILWSCFGIRFLWFKHFLSVLLLCGWKKCLYLHWYKKCMIRFRSSTVVRERERERERDMGERKKVTVNK